jgi:hypothetical protein
VIPDDDTASASATITCAQEARYSPSRADAIASAVVTMVTETSENGYRPGSDIQVEEREVGNKLVAVGRNHRLGHALYSNRRRRGNQYLDGAGASVVEFEKSSPS